MILGLMMISDPVLVACIAAVPALVAALGAVMSIKGHGLIMGLQKQFVDVRLSLNGRLDQFLNAMEAKGQIHGRKDLQAEQLAEVLRNAAEVLTQQKAIATQVAAQVAQAPKCEAKELVRAIKDGDQSTTSILD